MPTTLLNVDLSQAELRVSAVLSGDKWLRASLQEGGGDFFDQHMLPVAYPGTVARYGSVELFKRAEPVEHKETRTSCKGVMYGLAFGRGAQAIAKEIGMKARGAQVIIDNLFETAPEFAQWRDDIMEAAVDPSKRDMLTTVFGRRYQRELITSSKQEAAVKREALAFLPQSTASDICLSTAIRVHPMLKSAGYRIFNVVHDAIMVEGPDEDADMVGAYIGLELRKTGLEMLGDSVPFLSDYSKGTDWGMLS